METKYDLKRLWLTRGVFALLFTMLLLFSGVVSAQTFNLTVYGPGNVTVSSTDGAVTFDPDGAGALPAAATVILTAGAHPITVIGATAGVSPISVNALGAPFYQWMNASGLTLSALPNVSPNSFLYAAGVQNLTASFYQNLTVNLLGAGSSVDVSVGSVVPAISANVNVSGNTVSIPGHVTEVNITANPAGAPDLGYGFYQWVGTTITNTLLAATDLDFAGADFGAAKTITLDTRKIIDFTFVTTPSNKTYDGTNAAVAPTPTALYGLGGLTFTTGVFTFNSVNAALAVPMTGVMTITDAGHMFSTTLPGGALTKTYNPTADITPRPISLTANSFNKTYGDTYTYLGTEFTLSAGTFAAGESITSLTMTSTGTPASAAAGAHPTAITPLAGGNYVAGGAFLHTNYAITPVNGVLTVDPRPISLTANSFNKTYGNAYTFLGTEFTLSAGTFAAGESITSLTITSTGSGATAAAGAHPNVITALAGGNYVGAGGFLHTNYAITPVNGTLTVDPRPISLTANSFNKTYGDTYTFLGTEFTLSAGTFATGESITSLTITSTGAVATGAAGPHPTIITPLAALNYVGAGGFLHTNYAITPVNGVLTVDPRPISLTANSFNKTYGDTYTFLGTEFTLSAGTFAPGESITSLTITSAGAIGTAAVGGYPTVITPLAALNYVGAGGFLHTNYAITPVNGTLTVDPRPISLTANSFNKTYGDTYTFLGTEFSLSAGTFAPGESITSLTITSGGAIGTAAVGGYPTVITPLAALNYVGAGGFLHTNYAITPVNGTLTVDPRPISLTANSFNKTYGNLYTFLGTEFTLSAGTFATGESITSLTITSTGSPAVAPAGPHPTVITPLAGGNYVGAGGFLHTNYAITPVNGVLTVDPRPISLTANSFNKTYGNLYTFLGTEFTLSAGTFATGESITSLTITSAGAIGTAPVGGYPTIITPLAGGNYVGAGGFLHTNYAITPVNGTLTVDPRPIALTANSFSKTYGVVYTFAGTEFTLAAGTYAPGESITTLTLTSSGTLCDAPVLGVHPTVITPLAVGNYVGAGGFVHTNYLITPYTNGLLTVNAANLTITANNRTKVYGEIVVPAGTEFTTSALACSDVINSVTLTSTGFAQGATYIAPNPTYAIVPSVAVGAPFIASNYNINYVPGTLTVTQRLLAVVNAVAQDKVYDGNQVAVVTGAAPSPFVLSPPSGMMPGDDIFLNNHTSGAFQPNATVANGKPVTTAITLGGTAAGNYNFNPATSLMANITARPLVITATPGQSKVYGTADPVFAYTTNSGVNTGLAPGQSFIGALSRTNPLVENVGTYSITIGTLLADNPPFSPVNYTVTFNSANFEITPRQLTITGAVANNKVYDGNTTATVSGATLAGAQFTDALTLVNDLVGTFDSENVGNSKVVTTNMTVTGAAIANYTQPVTPVLSANITPKALTATSVAAGKVYDGTTAAALTSALVGLVGGDDVTLTNGTVGTFASANVGTWAVSNTIGITGTDVPNYTWTAPVVAPATISARPITVNVPTGQSKQYGQPDPVFAYSITAGTLAPGHTWSGALSRTPGEDVGTYNYITSPLIISDAGNNNVTANYNITYTALPLSAGSFSITPATTPLVITANDFTKFRCAADPTFTVTATGLYFGDVVTAVLSRTPAGNDPGTYTINIDSYTVTTGNPLNYSNISTVPGTLTIIDGPADLVATIVGFGNVIVRKQNGSVAAELAGPVVNTTVSGFSFNEIISLEAVAAPGYVFTGWTVDLTGMTNPGTLTMDCGKFVTATFKKVVYLSDIIVNAPNKTYDGDNLVKNGPTAVYNGVLYGNATIYQQPAPVVTWTSATYDNANWGNNKPVVFDGFALSPNPHPYYQLAPGVVSKTTTSSILKRNLNVSNASVPSRPYDGTTVATITGAALNHFDIVGTETLTLVLGNHTTGTFVGTAATGASSGANVSDNKTVSTSMTLSGPTAANYTLIQPSLTGNVTPRTLTFTAVSITPKPFDGIVPAAATVASVGASTTWGGLITDDAAKFSVNVAGANATFNNQWPGTNKPVTVTGGITMTTNVGHTATYNAGNYEIVYQISTTGTILPPAYAMFTPTYAVNRPQVPVQNVPINTPLSVEFSVNVADINGDALPTNDLGDFIDFQYYDLGTLSWVDVAPAAWSATRSNRTITINHVGPLAFATEYRIIFTGIYIAGTTPLVPLTYTLDGATRDNTIPNALVVGNMVRFRTMNEYTWTLPVVTPYGSNIGVCNKNIVLTFRNPVEYRNGNQITDNPKHKFTLQYNSGSGWTDVPAADWGVSIDVPGNPKVFTFNYNPTQFGYNTQYRVRMNVSLVDGLRGFTDKVFNYPNQAWMDSEFASIHTQGNGWEWTTTAMYPVMVAVSPLSTGFGATPYNQVTFGAVGTFSATTTFNIGVTSPTYTMTPVASEGYKFVNWERTLNGGTTWTPYTVSETWTFNAAAQAPLCTQGLGYRANFVIKNYKVQRSPIANTAGGIVSVTGMTSTINTSTTTHNHGTTPVWTATPAAGKQLVSWSSNVPGAVLPAVPDPYATLTPAPGVASWTFSNPTLAENVTYTFTATFGDWTPRLKASAGFAGTGAQPATMIGLIQFTTNFVSSISNPGQESGLFQGLQYEQVDIKYDTVVTLFAHSAPCQYQFVKWQYYNPTTATWIDYVSAGNPLGANPITFKMNQNIRFKAVYQMRTNVAVSATAMNPALGTVIIFSDAARTNPIHINDVVGGQFAPGTTLYITSFPEPDYYTWRWDIVGGVTNTNTVVLHQRYEDRSEWTYTVGCNDTHLKAVIGLKEYQIFVRSENGARGTIGTSSPAWVANTSGMPGRGLGFEFNAGVDTVTGSGWFQRTGSVTFRAVDKANWAFDYWRVTGTTTDAGIVSYERNYTVNNIQSGMDLTAVFKSTLPPAPTYTVSVLANPATGASALFGAGQYVANSSPGAVSVTASFSVAPGYTFTNWTAQGVSIVTPTLTSQTFAMPAAPVTLTANFAKTQYTVQANVRTYLRATPISDFAVVNYGGTVSPATGTFTYGQTATFTATPLPGFRFVNWMEGEIVSMDGRILRGRMLTDNPTLNYVVPPVAGNPLRHVYAIFVEIALPEYPILTLTTVANPAGYGTLTGAGQYAYGIQALVTQTPAVAGYEFTNWSGNVTTAPVAYVNMTSSQTATANYQLKNYNLNVYAIGAGTVSGTGTFTVASLPMPVAATPATGNCDFTYSFMGWYTDALATTPLTDAGGNIISDPNFNFIPYALPGTQTSVNIWAKFGTVSKTYTVTAATALNAPANLNNAVGTVSITGATAPYVNGTSLVVSTTPAAGYAFQYWTDPTNTLYITQQTFNHVVSCENSAFIAVYEAIPYTLTASAQTGGSVTPATGTFTIGQAVSVTATASTGYEFDGWTATGVTLANAMANPAAFNMPTNNVTLVAKFKKINYTVTATAQTGGTAAPASQVKTFGDAVTVTATVNAGYVFAGWTATGVTLANPMALVASFSMPANNVTLQATFTAVPYTVALVATPANGGTFSAVAPSYTVGQAVSVTATANAGFEFVSWSGVTGVNLSSPTLSFNMPAGNVTLTATFAPLGNTLTGGVKYFNQFETTMPVASNFQVQLFNGASLVATSGLDANGKYSFTGIAPGTNYTLKVNASGINTSFGGVTAADALVTNYMVIQSPVLASFPWIDPTGSATPVYTAFSQKVADVNNAGGVTALDALSILFRTVGNISSFPNNVDFQLAAAEVASMTAKVYPQAPTHVFNFASGEYSGNWTGKAGQTILNLYFSATGDVNASFIPQGGSKAKMNLNYTGEKVVTVGEEVVIPVRIDQTVQLGAMTLGISFNSQLLQVTAVEGYDVVNIDNNNGTVRIAWMGDRNVFANETIVNITAKVLAPVDASTRYFEIESMTEFAGINANPYDGISLSTVALTGATSVIEAAELVSSAYPNPFNDVATINFTMPEAGKVTVVVYNQFGQEVKTLVNEVRQAGVQYTEKLNRADLSGSGTYFYRILVEGAAKTYSAKGTLILVK